MSIELVNQIIKEALITVLLASAPALVIGLIVGLIISIFQAASQIQEVTLSFIPKIVAIFISLIVFGPWIINVVVKYTTNLLSNLSNYGTM
jgi:flagellar biosynthetic protein FliQ